MTMQQQEMLNHACARLEHSFEAHKGRTPYRNKAHHTRRVCGWAMRIGQEEGAGMDIVLAACAFHDIGYSVDKQNHALTGAQMAREYLAERGYAEAFMGEVCHIIENHGDRGLLKASTPLNTLIVIEADNIDEKGPMALIRDAMAEGTEPEQSYEKTYRRVLKHHLRGDHNICVTSAARRIWDERQQAVKQFLSVLKRDLFLGEPDAEPLAMGGRYGGA